MECFDKFLHVNTYQFDGMDHIELQEEENIAEPSSTILKVEDAIRKLKNNKVPGMDLIETESIKNFRIHQSTPWPYYLNFKL